MPPRDEVREGHAAEPGLAGAPSSHEVQLVRSHRQPVGYRHIIHPRHRGDRGLSVGLVASIQTHGSLANWHPHLQLLVTDGGFRADGTFVPLPLHDVTTLTEAFRRAVLRLFVRRELMDVETAQGMLAWPHSGLHVHDGVWVAAADRSRATRWRGARSSIESTTSGRCLPKRLT